MLLLKRWKQMIYKIAITYYSVNPLHDPLLTDLDFVVVQKQKP